MNRMAVNGFLVAAFLGMVHAISSLYWGLGGTLLIDTVGEIADTIGDRRWALIAVGALKAGFALGPLLILWRRGQLGGRTRALCWVVAGSLTVWGAVNTVTATLLIAEVIPRPTPYDSVGTLGHAAIWDPLFLGWGVAVIVALLASRADMRQPVRATQKYISNARMKSTIQA